MYLNDLIERLNTLTVLWPHARAVGSLAVIDQDNTLVEVIRTDDAPQHNNRSER